MYGFELVKALAPKRTRFLLFLNISAGKETKRQVQQDEKFCPGISSKLKRSHGNDFRGNSRSLLNLGKNGWKGNCAWSPWVH